MTIDNYKPLINIFGLLFTLCPYFVSVISGNNIVNRTFFLIDFCSLNYLVKISLKLQLLSV